MNISAEFRNAVGKDNPAALGECWNGHQRYKYRLQYLELEEGEFKTLFGWEAMG